MRIGDGSGVNVWNAPWLPDSDNGKIETDKRMEFPDMMVAGLKENEVKAWGVSKVSSIFDDRDARMILSIPLRLHRTVDSWYQLEDRREVYTVKSGYKLVRGMTQPQTNENRSEVWNSIWRVRAMPKMKDLLWRAASNCIPTRSRLFQGHII